MKSAWLIFFCAVAIIFDFSWGNIELQEIPFDDKIEKAACDFTVDILRHLSLTTPPTTNFIFSPSNILISMSALLQASDGETKFDLEDLLGLTPEESEDGYRHASDIKAEQLVDIEWGNRCYLNSRFEVNHDYEKLAKEAFDLEIEKLDFGNPSPRESASVINKWAEAVSSGGIDDLVDPSFTSEKTMMLMVSLFSFNSNWLYSFEKRKSKLKKFETTQSDYVETIFMSQKGKYVGGEFKGVKYIHLPYQNENFVLVLLLPSLRHNMTSVLRTLTGNDLFEIFSEEELRIAKIRIPRFSFSSKLLLREILTMSGLGESLDLGHMTPEKLALTEMIHLSGFKVVEDGISPANYSLLRSGKARHHNMPFVANQPFLFFLFHKPSMMPLLAGRMSNPTL